MLVFAAYPSARVKYILDYILFHRFGLNYHLTDKLDYFQKSKENKIHYGQELVEGCLNIPSISLLFEESIKEQKIQVVKDEKWLFQFFFHPYRNIPDFKHQTHYLPFDILSATFYLLSRYEEYLPSKKDEHNRFKPENSLAYKHGFLEIPLLDFWLIRFEKILKKQFPDIEFKSHQFKQLNTIDIDFAYKYKGHSFWALGRKFLGSILKRKIDKHSLVQPETDPYDTYMAMLEKPNRLKIETIFFLLLADYGGNDKNISPHSIEMKNLVQTLTENHSLGIHPSYKAGIQPKTNFLEHKVFKTLTGEIPKKSRHHFLKIRLPDSYAQMENLEIEKDYSMAYSGKVGFRASTCFPFKFFDLTANIERNIEIYSPCLMDVTLKNSLNLSKDKAIERINQLKETVREVDGYFISIWHNSSFDPTQGWAEWEDVYQSLFD
jgi:hypothetical protein